MFLDMTTDRQRAGASLPLQAAGEKGIGVAGHYARSSVRIGALIVAHTLVVSATAIAAEPEAKGAAIKLPAASIKIQIAPSWPKTLPEAKAEQEAAKLPPEAWPATDIAAAKSRCDAILKKISAIAIPEAPIKQGSCGAPAPIQLISIGKNPQVSISPPAVVTCELAEALSLWLEKDLQPLARTYFNSEIIKIESMSSYSCRNAYGRKGGRLSEHGVANALDIRGFVTANAEQTYVLEDWGKPQREIIAEIAAAKAEEQRIAALKAAAEKAAQANQQSSKGAPAKMTPPSATASSEGAPAAGIARRTITDGIPKITVTIPGGAAPQKDNGGSGDFSFAEPDRLGGPKADAKVPAAAAASPALKIAKSKIASKADRKREFLHASHRSACSIFGTTLGPEANAAHRNHFHVDMAYRRVTKICD